MTKSKASTYTVGHGDTLSAIAAELLGSATRWPDIAALNGLNDPNLIHPGQTLKLPALDKPGAASISRGKTREGVTAKGYTLAFPRGWWLSELFTDARSLDGKKHHAIDVAIRSGTLIRAPYSGVVKRTGVIGGYGGVVELVNTSEVDGEETVLLSRFAHCENFYVRPGDTVKAGAVLATSGGGPNDKNRGYSTGAHLHYELHLNGTPVNPLDYLAVVNER